MSESAGYNKVAKYNKATVKIDISWKISVRSQFDRKLFFTKLFFASDLFVREGVKLGMVIFEIRFQKRYNYSCPKPQCYPFVTPQYMRNENFTFPDF